MHAGRPGRAARYAVPCLAAAAAALALALALASCGGSSTEATAKAGTVDPTAKQVPDAVGGSRCAGQVGNLLAAMDGLRSDLVAGLAYEQYVGEVKKIVASYEAVPVDQLALGCLRAAGTPGEKALNRYIAAGNAWTDCVEVPSCEAASIESQLQGEWRRASRYLSKAQHGLGQQASG